MGTEQLESGIVQLAVYGLRFGICVASGIPTATAMFPLAILSTINYPLISSLRA
ncbi:MAG: hypothetical protein LBU34_13615 [Planctomycetaceae bacterium]|nr:hypothetical protein [Planctomycetaceae bacterium]